MRSAIANVIDIEHDRGSIIEIGLTTVDLRSREILKTYSLPISDVYQTNGWSTFSSDVSPEIQLLTGWTAAKLKKQGSPYYEACLRIRDKYGGQGRLLVGDNQEDRDMIHEAFKICITRKFGMSPAPSRMPLNNEFLNVAHLFRIMTGELDRQIGLDAMLAYFDMQFLGTRHRAGDDSRNIARVFLRLLDADLFPTAFSSPSWSCA